MINKFKHNVARKFVLNFHVNDDSFSNISKIIVFSTNEVKHLLKQLYNKSSKKIQINVVEYLIVERNIIIIVKIDFDKNMIFHLMSTLCKKFIVFIIMSLNVLQMNQIDDIKKLKMNEHNMKSCVVNNNIMFDVLLKKIRIKKYTHIFIESKIVLKNKKFRVVMQHVDF